MVCLLFYLALSYKSLNLGSTAENQSTRRNSTVKRGSLSVSWLNQILHQLSKSIWSQLLLKVKQIGNSYLRAKIQLWQLWIVMLLFQSQRPSRRLQISSSGSLQIDFKFWIEFSKKNCLKCKLFSTNWCFNFSPAWEQPMYSKQHLNRLGFFPVQSQAFHILVYFNNLSRLFWEIERFYNNDSFSWMSMAYMKTVINKCCIGIHKLPAT